MVLLKPVLAQYPGPLRGPAVALGNHGGFSGARLWRVEAPAGTYCLRAWPKGDMDVVRLGHIHGLMLRARNVNVEFVPRPMQTLSGTTFLRHALGLWELTEWMPGRADYWHSPSLKKVRAACSALALLHCAWRDPNALPRFCPAVQRRFAAAQEWRQRLADGWRIPDDAMPIAMRARTAMATHLADVDRRLEPWKTRSVPLQPCLCDVWHDHVLFTGDRVTGLVDFGSIKHDHVAVDLARLLGSLVGDDAPYRAAGLEAYTQINPLTPAELRLVDDLDRTGVIVAALNWLRWLYVEKRVYPDQTLVARRLERLVERMESWIP